MKRFYFIILIGILIAGCQSNNESKSDQEITTESNESISDKKVAETKKSIAYKLAVLEKGGYVSENDNLVKRFDNLIQQLDNKYNVNKQQIGDMTYKLKEVAGNRGITVSMIKAMEGATQVGNLTYAEYLGNYLTLREKGYLHDNTIESIKLLK